MNGNIPAWTTASTGQPAALCMSAATMTAGTACCWRTASLACVYRVSAIRCSAAGLPPLSCPLMKHWKPPSCAGKPETLRCLRGVLLPKINREILPGLRRTHEADKRRQTEAETKGEMSRFRAFQTRINQGFLEGVKGCVIHLSFSLKNAPKSVTEPTDRHHKEVNPIADYMTAGTELPAYLPYPVSCWKQTYPTPQESYMRCC